MADTAHNTTIDTQFLGRNVEDAAVGAVLTYDGSSYAQWEAPAGGSQPSTQTATVTTDPNTYTVSHTFDMGQMRLVCAEMEAVSFVADGETFGTGSGDIAAAYEVAISEDGTHFVPPSGLAYDRHAADANGTLSSPGDEARVLYTSFRYVRWTILLVDDQNNPYSGPNHPTATVTVTVEYV